MTQLATRDQFNGGGNGPQGAAGGAVPVPLYPIQELWEMAQWVAASGLFGGCKNPEQAFTLMLICQSEGLHPIQAMRRYHIIPSADGPRPSMRADAMQAEFQARGGVVKMIRCDPEEARAFFAHPKYLPDGIERALTYKECLDAGITRGREGEKKNWRESRADMLWSRLVTKNIRKIYPGIVSGIYSADEIDDMDTPQLSTETLAKLNAPVPSALPSAPAQLDPPVPGYSDSGFDGRPYVRVAEEAVEAHNAAVAEAWKGVNGVDPPAVNVRDLHRHLLFAAINLGHAEGPPPSGLTRAIGEISQVYKAHRAWVRTEVVAYLAREAEAAESALRDATEATAEALDPDDYGGVVPAEVA